MSHVVGSRARTRGTPGPAVLRAGLRTHQERLGQARKIESLRCGGASSRTDRAESRGRARTCWQTYGFDGCAIRCWRAPASSPEPFGPDLADRGPDADVRRLGTRGTSTARWGRPGNLVSAAAVFVAPSSAPATRADRQGRCSRAGSRRRHRRQRPPRPCQGVGSTWSRRVGPATTLDRRQRAR